MQDLQEIFNRIQEIKKDIGAIRAAYKDMLSATGDYEDIKHKLDGYRLRKKQIENSVKEQMAKEFDDMERLKFDLVSDQMLLSDLALSKYLKGQSIEITDAKNAKYDPVFSVKFKKAQ